MTSPLAARLATDLRTIATVIAAATLALGVSGDPFPLRLGLVALALAPWYLAAVPRVPRAVAAATLVPSAVLFWRDDQLAGMFAVLLLIDVAAEGRPLPTALALAAGLAIVIPPYVLTWHQSAWAYWAGGLVISIFGGWSFHTQRVLQEELSEARAELDRRALLEERRRIARDVHDLVAHSLTVVMLHLTAARLAVERDPAGASATLAEAEHLGRQALVEVRRVVELLRHDDDGAIGPLPSVRDLPELVSRLCVAGMTIDLRTEGDASRLSPSASLALYRVAQEALSNAGRHAPGARVEVSIEVGGGEARLSVRNGPAPSHIRVPARSAGNGLAGMRERATLLGGTLHGGPDGRGWLVECVIPA